MEFVKHSNSRVLQRQLSSQQNFSSRESKHYDVYKPEGAVGIRYKKQIFTKRDLGYIGFSSHILESVFRKKHFLTFFDQASESEQLNYDDYLVSEVCPSGFFNSDEQHANHYCSQDMLLFTYLSTNYYKPRNDYIQNPFKNETLLWGGIQIQSSDRSQDIDFPRDNFYLNYALGVKNNYEIPMAPIEEVEIEQIIESFLYKKAKTHNRENFIRFAELYGPERIETLEVFQTFTYTFDDVYYISNMTNGLKPQSISQINHYNPLFKFFHNEFEVSPSHKITFDECQILIPKRFILTIDNLSKTKPLLLKDFRTSSPELTPYLSNGKDFPIKLGPLSSLEIQLVFLPETLGLFESVFYISVNDVVFVGSVNAFVITNQFELTPIYVVDVTLNQKIEREVKMFNPNPNATLVIEELWATDRYVTLYWPNGELIPQSFDSFGNAEPSKEPINNSEYMKLQPMKESVVFKIFFQVNQTQDYYTEIQIRTSNHDIIRLPIYFHVHSDVIKFLPPIADFGLVPLNFELMKIAVRGKIKTSEPLKINDVFVPIGDSRIDFIMVESRSTDRSMIFRPDQEFLFGYIMLASHKPGLIMQKIIINATGILTNRTYKIEYAIMGNVNENSHMLQGNIDTIISAMFKDHTPPMITFDVSEYIINQQTSRLLFVIPQFRPVILSAPLLLKNTFNMPISIKGIINNNRELKVNLLPGINHDILYKELIVKPNETVKFAQIEVLTTSLKISQGMKFISIQVNETFIPATVQIYDRHLTCVWDEYQKSRFLQCGQGYDINFGYVPVGEPKQKRLNITNLNPHSITIENIVKSQLDDLIVFVDRILDKSGKQVPIEKNLTDEKDGRFNLMTQKRTKKIVNLTIHPQQTVSIIFQIISKEPKQKSSKIEFQTRKKETSDFTFNYNYHIVDGNLTIVPQTIRFNQAFSGQIQTKPLIARSTFDVPIVIKQMTSSDIRIFPQFSHSHSSSSNIIMPRNKTEIGSVSFDSNRINNQLLIQTFDNAMFGHQQALDQHMSQHIMALINSGQIPQNGQITMILNQGEQVQINSLGSKLIQNTMGNMPNQRQLVTVNDLLQYKDKQKSWDDLGTQGKTEISAMITIETNVFQNISVQVKAHMTRPTIMVDDVLDFETVQIGTFSMKSIKIINPCDEPLMISVFLTNNPLNKAQELNNMFPANQSSELWNEQLTGYYLPPNHAVSVYCNSRLLSQKLNNQTIPSQVNSDGQFIFEEVLFVSNISDQNLVCEQLKNVLNSQDFDITYKEGLLKQLENFYKQLANEEYEKMNEFQMNQVNKNLMQMNKNLIKKQNQGGNVDFNNVFNMEDIMKDFNDTSGETAQSSQNKDLENYAGQINKVSVNRFIDLYTLNMIRMSERANTQGFFETLKNLLKPPSHQNSPKYKLLKNATLGQQQQYQEYLIKQELKKQKRFRLKNQILNDIILNNDTSKFDHEFLDVSTSRTITIANQSFYINPKIQGVQFKVDPRSNLTIREAIIFQPQSIFEEEIHMQLIVKNNLTHLYQVELKGSSGTGIVEITQVLKKQVNTDSYVSVPNVYSQYSQYYSDIKTESNNGNSQEGNESESLSQKMVRQKILNYIYGDRDHLFENKTFNTYQIKQQELEKVIHFNIAVEDMILIQDGRAGDNSDNENYNILTDILTDKYENIKLNTYHKRIFVAQNIGNLPLSIDIISIENQGCKAYGILIENCHSFQLKPGESHQIHISFTTDYTIGKLKKAIILESKTFYQEIQLQIQMPMALLPLANEIMPLTSFEETFYIILKLVILSAGILCVLYISKDIVNHFKFKQEQIHQERLDIQLQQDSYLKLNHPIKHKEIPVLREMLAHDQIFNVYYSAQEKFDNPNQLLLKEISNLCNKKSLVIVEAQKQAIDAEKDRRAQQRIMYSQNIAANKYIEQIRDEEQEQFITIYQQNSDSKQKHKIHQKNQISKDNAIFNIDSDQFTKVEAGRNQGGQKQKQGKLSSEDISMTTSREEITPSKQYIKQDSTQIQVNEVQKVTTEPKKETPVKDVTKKQAQEIKSDASSHEQDQDQTDALQQQSQPQTSKPHKVIRLSKKQQRETAQRIKEQQELEERFRQAQKRKEEEELLEKKRKEQETQRAREIAKRAEKELQRMKEEEELIKISQDKSRQDTEQASDSLDQSINLERDNSLNLSQLEKHKSKDLLEDQNFKQELDYLGDLNEKVEDQFEEPNPNQSDGLKKSPKDKAQLQNQSSTLDKSSEELKDTQNQQFYTRKVFIDKTKQQTLSYQHQPQYQSRDYRIKQQQTQLTQGQGTAYYNKYQSYGARGHLQEPRRIESKDNLSQGRRAYNIPNRGFYQSGTTIAGRGRSRGGYYKPYEYEENNEEEYQQKDFYYNKRQYSKEEYQDKDEFQYVEGANEGQFKQKFQRKQVYTSESNDNLKAEIQGAELSQQQKADSLIEEEFKEHMSQDQISEERKSVSHDQSQHLQDEAFQDIQVNTQMSDSSSGKKLEGHESEQEQSPLNDSQKTLEEVIEEKTGGQLSRDDLRPFFESQKRPEDSGQKQQRQSLLGNLVSPTSIGQSIFSFNPLNIFSQPIGVNHQTQQNYQNIEGDDSPESQEYEKDLSKLIDDDDDDQSYSNQRISQPHQVNNLQQNRYQSQTSFGTSKQGTEQKNDFYNTFKSASSLFSKPLFGATIQKINEAKQLQNQQSQQLMRSSLIVDTSQNEEQYEQEEDNEEEQNTSLFSGSLFGDSGPFSNQKKQISQTQVQENIAFNASDYYNRSSQPAAIQRPPVVQDEFFFPPPGLTAPATNPQVQSLPTSQSFTMGINPYQQQLLQQQQQQQIRNVQFQPQSSSSSLFSNTFGLGFAQNYGQNIAAAPTTIPPITQQQLTYFELLQKQHQLQQAQLIQAQIQQQQQFQQQQLIMNWGVSPVIDQQVPAQTLNSPSDQTEQTNQPQSQVDDLE